MLIEGLSDWQKRRLALILKDKGYTAFMVIKHASAAIQSMKRNRPVNSVDQENLNILDDTVRELYGYERFPNQMRYDEPARVILSTKGLPS